MALDLNSTFDALIVGAGPAGLAAAIYLGRYLRPTLLINEPEPPTRWHRPTAHNVLGFPAGIMRSQLLEWGRCQATSHPNVRQQSARVVQLACDGELFAASDAKGRTFRGRGLILAMGVEYELPQLENIVPYAGRSVFHCPECDGYKTKGKKVVVLGNGDGTAEMALRLLVWTDALIVCTNGREPAFGAQAAQKLDAASIAVETGTLAHVEGDAATGAIAAVCTPTRRIACDAVFSNIPCEPPTELYAQLGLKLHQGRWVITDHRQRTNVPRCYAAGDIVAFAQTQLSVAMGQGATAGINLHLELLPESMRLS